MRSSAMAAKQAQRNTATSGSRTRLIMLHTVVPVAIHGVGVGNLQRPDQTEAQARRVGVIPDALRQLRILLLPACIRCHARSAPHLLGAVRPCSTANGLRVGGRRFHPWFGDRRRGRLVGRVLVERPFHHVAKHVVQAPGIRRLCRHLLVLAFGIVRVPGVVAKVGRLGPDPARQAYSHSASVGRR